MMPAMFSREMPACWKSEDGRRVKMEEEGEKDEG
jgi:hypothetical protein